MKKFSVINHFVNMLAILLLTTRAKTENSNLKQFCLSDDSSLQPQNLNKSYKPVFLFNQNSFLSKSEALNKAGCNTGYIDESSSKNPDLNIFLRDPIILLDTNLGLKAFAGKVKRGTQYNLEDQEKTLHYYEKIYNKKIPLKSLPFVIDGGDVSSFCDDRNRCFLVVGCYSNKYIKELKKIDNGASNDYIDNLLLYSSKSLVAKSFNIDESNLIMIEKEYDLEKLKNKVGEDLEKIPDFIDKEALIDPKHKLISLATNLNYHLDLFFQPLHKGYVMVNMDAISKDSQKRLREFFVDRIVEVSGDDVFYTPTNALICGDIYFSPTIGISQNMIDDIEAIGMKVDDSFFKKNDKQTFANIHCIFGSVNNFGSKNSFDTDSKRRALNLYEEAIYNSASKERVFYRNEKPDVKLKSEEKKC